MAVGSGTEICTLITDRVSSNSSAMNRGDTGNNWWVVVNHVVYFFVEVDARRLRQHVCFVQHSVAYCISFLLCDIRSCVRHGTPPTVITGPFGIWPYQSFPNMVNERLPVVGESVALIDVITGMSCHKYDFFPVILFVSQNIHNNFIVIPNSWWRCTLNFRR